MSFKNVLIHVALYAGVLAVAAKLLPWVAFIPVAVLVSLLHLYIIEKQKRRQHRALFKNVKANQIEGFPVFEPSGRRPIDEVIIESLLEVTTELEKKCYQLVEKNIQLLSLKEISLTIISSLDEGRIVDSVQSFLSKGLGFKEIFIGIFTPDIESLRVYSFREAFGTSSNSENTVRVGDLQGLLKRSVVSRKPVLIKDPEMHPIGSLNGQAIFEDSTMDSYLIVPMVKSKFSRDCWKASNCVLKTPVLSIDAGTLTDAVCPGCGKLPVLGLIGVTDGFKAASLSRVDLVAVETLALQISTLLENAQLYNELQKEESFRENVINSMLNGLITVDTKGAILLANETAEGLSGYTGEELKGMHIDDLIMDSSDDESGPVVRALRSNKNMYQKESWVIKKDGQKLPIMLNTSFLLDENKKIQGALGVFLDTTRIKRMEQKIVQLDKLAALGRFSSSMAHEIRNPLTGIVAGLQYLKRVGGIPTAQDENISFILSEVNRIDRLITDILNVVRGGDLVYHPVKLESVLSSSVKVVQELADKRSVNIGTEFPKKSRTVVIDSDRITQVVINLLKNAVEASDTGSEVRVKMWFPHDDNDVLFDEMGNLVIIEIQDQGVGFSEENKGKIFEPFFTTKPDGTGLGLYVTHSIVERHGGYIFVESEKGEGSVFTVYLPVEKVGHGDSSEISHPLGR